MGACSAYKSKHVDQYQPNFVYMFLVVPETFFAGLRRGGGEGGWNFETCKNCQYWRRIKINKGSIMRVIVSPSLPLLFAYNFNPLSACLGNTHTIVSVGGVALRKNNPKAAEIRVEFGVMEVSEFNSGIQIFRLSISSAPRCGSENGKNVTGILLTLLRYRLYLRLSGLFLIW